MRKILLSIAIISLISACEEIESDFESNTAYEIDGEIIECDYDSGLNPECIQIAVELIEQSNEKKREKEAPFINLQ